jgi:hypothetical protein
VLSVFFVPPRIIKYFFAKTNSKFTGGVFSERYPYAKGKNAVRRRKKQRTNVCPKI